MLKLLREHPIAVGAASIFGAAACIATIWTAVSHDTIPEAFEKWRGGVTWPFWHYVLATVLTIAVLGLQARVIQVLRRPVGNESAATAPTTKLDYDPSKPKRFTTKTVHELFDITYSKESTRAKDALLDPHKGLWIYVEGVIIDLDDGIGDDGEGGRWMKASIRYVKDKQKLLEFPRSVGLYFLGADADVVRALAIGDFIRANGRIEHLPVVLGELGLAPAELIDYRRGDGAVDG